MDSVGGGMIHRSFLHALNICVATALLVGCGGSQAPEASGVLPQNRGGGTDADAAGSWMLPEATRVKKLLYISDQSTDRVYVYNYATKRLLGRLHGFYQPAGQCVDTKGDVWITDSAGEAVVEYAHGAVRRTNRIRTIGLANSCSIDPTSGNLAVSNSQTPQGKSNIEVFDLAGAHKTYSSSACQNIVQVGYDSSGNLYVSASSEAFTSYVCEVPHGGKALRRVPIDQTIQVPSGVMWDGKYITFTDEFYAFDYSAIYQAEPNRSGGLHVVSQTDFQGGGSGDCQLTAIVQPFIVGNQNTPSNNEQGNVVVGSNEICYSGSGHPFLYWNYPKGGAAAYTLFDAPINPSGEAVSIAL